MLIEEVEQKILSKKEYSLVIGALKAEAIKLSSGRKPSKSRRYPPGMKPARGRK